MPLFTFTPQFEDSTGEPAEVDCPDAVTAIKQARGHLQAIINESPTVNRASIGVGDMSPFRNSPERHGISPAEC